MLEDNGRLTRRSILRRTGIAASGLAVGTATFSGQAVADEHCADPSSCLRVCWMDVKPNSCPNSVNQGSSGVLPVMAGWPYFDPTTVELIPVSADYEPEFDECQYWSDPVYGDSDQDSTTASELCQLAADPDRSATPISMRNEDVDDDGDLDAKFRFRVEDLELEPDDNFLILVGESTTNGCTYYAIDSVRVVGGGNEGNGDEGRGNDGNGNNGK